MAKGKNPVDGKPMGRGKGGLVAGANLGQRIRSARERAGMKKAEFARAMGCAWQTVNRWETGAFAPTAESLEMICKVLSVTPEELLGIAAGQAPPFESWATFLGTPEGQSMSAEEVDALRAFNWPSGRAPTVTTYAMLLLALRSAPER